MYHHLHEQQQNSHMLCHTPLEILFHCMYHIHVYYRLQYQLQYDDHMPNECPCDHTHMLCGNVRDTGKFVICLSPKCFYINSLLKLFHKKHFSRSVVTLFDDNILYHNALDVNIFMSLCL